MSNFKAKISFIRTGKSINEDKEFKTNYNKEDHCQITSICCKKI